MMSYFMYFHFFLLHSRATVAISLLLDFIDRKFEKNDFSRRPNEKVQDACGLALGWHHLTLPRSHLMKYRIITLLFEGRTHSTKPARLNIAGVPI